jgi:hypothetical protein
MGKGRWRRALLAGTLLACFAAQTAFAADTEIKVLSNRADIISGGDALVAVSLPDGTDPSTVTVSVGDRDVTDSFALRENGRYEGLITGLDLGANVVTAKLPDGSGAKLTITNHPNGGPVFSGPHVQPWVCQATAEDELCNQDPTYEFRYKNTSGEMGPYDPANPPSDVATTTTDQGETVPYIVRIETGYQDRDQYKIAVLYNPDEPWAPWNPQRGWNHKLLITHGASCGIERHAGSAPDVMDDTALSRGFAVASTALNNAGHNCNIVTQAESMVMAKERLVEQYGDLRYTIGTGCSGGSLTQQQVANSYPGIYQGILPACSFPDAWSTGQQLVDYHLLRAYLEDPTKWGPGVAWTPLQIGLVEGHPNHVNSIVFDTIYWTDLGVPDDGCDSVPAEDTYNAQTNPSGIRCTLADYMINVFGPRPESDWGPQEQALGQGFAGLPLDNVGVQYGLDPLQKGLITPAQFVDLNSNIGGETIDVVPTAERFPATQPALENAYKSGAVNTGAHLNQVAIIDLRGPDPGAFHDAYRSWATRSRIEREHGTFANHVIWFGQVPLVGDPNYESEAIVAMDRWLAAVEADSSDKPLSQKILDNRPADLQDRCSQVDGVEQVTVPGIGTVCEHEQLQTRYGTPRTVAGEPISTDQNKCQLQPLRRTDYYPIEFTDAEWAQLQTAFPTGVCDWSEPGVSQQAATPWQTYQDADGNVIYGGTGLGAPPASETIPAPTTGGAQDPGTSPVNGNGNGLPTSTPGNGPKPKKKSAKKKKRKKRR